MQKDVQEVSWSLREGVNIPLAGVWRNTGANQTRCDRADFVNLAFNPFTTDPVDALHFVILV